MTEKLFTGTLKYNQNKTKTNKIHIKHFFMFLSFGLEGRIVVLIVPVPGHCFSSTFQCVALQIGIGNNYLSLVVRKPVFGVFDQVQQKPGCTIKEDG